MSVSSLISYFYFFSVLLGLYSYVAVDPLKSALGLLGTVLFLSVYISVFTYFWVPYFLVLLFLSGVLVVLITVTSLSRFTIRSYGGAWVYFLAGFLYPGYLAFPETSELSLYYVFDYIWVWSFLFLLVFGLLFFVSLVLYTPGALRKM